VAAPLKNYEMSSVLKPSLSPALEHLLSLPEVARALQWFETNAEAITDEQIRICSVPASPFNEHERAEYLRKKFLELDLTEVEIDEEGNCLGLMKGASPSPLIAVSAHLDTVFSKDTDFTVVRRDNRLFAPGIADDCSGLVALLALAQAIKNERITTEGSILFEISIKLDLIPVRLLQNVGRIRVGLFPKGDRKSVV